MHQLGWSSFFCKMFKIASKLRKFIKKIKKKLETIFPFWDNWIWKCSYKVSLLRRKYLLSAVNGLTNISMILQIIKTDFFQLSCLYRDQQILERCGRSDFKSISTRLPCHFSKDPLKGEFLDIYLTTYSGVRKFKNTLAMKVIFFWKFSKLNLNLVNVKINLHNIFGFLDNWIWKCCNKWPLIGREHLLSAVHWLENGPKI